MGDDLLIAFDQFRSLPVWKVFSNKSISNQAATAHEDFCAAGVAGATARAKFLQEASLDPPRFLRVIDCKVSVREQVVVIIDCPKKEGHDVRQASGSSCSSAINSPIEGYTAISHTYGQHVYDAFNCGCAADCRAHVRRAADPAKFPCKHDDAELQQRVIADVLGMCRLLVDAGVRYAWHDGVCIAQHDEKEVEHFIQHIAWIYAYAGDTVVFLHYIGHPMAPIAPPSYPDGPISRWQTRAWTFQEAALSKRRRYCVRRGASLEPCFGKYDDFLETLASWYEADGPNITQILDESDFFNLLQEMAKSLTSVDSSTFQGVKWQQHFQWIECISSWKQLLWSLRCSFPTIAHALDSCSSRESKHNGDRINSILGIARVKGFHAPKGDDTVEESTMNFFNRMGKAGLFLALFTTNKYDTLLDARPHTWYPTLCSQLMLTPSHFRSSGPNFHTDHLECEVRSEDGNLEVRGLLACVSVRVALVDRTGSFQGIICNAGAAAMQGNHDASLSAFADFLEYSLDPAGYGCEVLLANDNLRAPVLLGMAMRGGFSKELIMASGKNEHKRQQFWARVMNQLKETAELVGRMDHSLKNNGLLTGINALQAMKPELVSLDRFMEEGEETSVDPSLQFLVLGAITDLNFIESFNARLRQIEAIADSSQSAAAAAACVLNNIFWQQSNHSIEFKLIFPAEVFELISNTDDDEDEDEDFKVEFGIDRDDYTSQCRTQLSLWRSSRSFAAVMVQGHDVLSSSVEKVGCFLASPMLLQVVLQQSHCLTFLDKLVIS